MVDYLYQNRCGIQNSDYTFSLSDKLIEQVLKRIYEKFDVENEIDPDLFWATVQELNKAIDEGIPAEWGKRNEAFVQALKDNTAVFAAFKTHRQQNDLAALLLNENGDAKDFNTFRKDSLPVIGTYNTTWLKTEHDTAIKSARTAARFAQFMQDKDLFPNLRWVPSRAVNPRESHKVYYNTIRAITDRWWKNHYPGNVWGCQCDINNTDKPITHTGDMPVNVKHGTETSPGLSANPYFTKSIFSDTHPYVTESYLPKKKLTQIVLKQVKKLLKEGRP